MVHHEWVTDTPMKHKEEKVPIYPLPPHIIWRMNDMQEMIFQMLCAIHDIDKILGRMRKGEIRG